MQKGLYLYLFNIDNLNTVLTKEIVTSWLFLINNKLSTYKIYQVYHHLSMS